MTIPEDQIFSLLAAKADELFFLLNTQTSHFEYLSPGLTDLISLSSEQINDQPDHLFSVVHSEDQAYLRQQIADFNNHGKLQVELRVITGGDSKYVKLHAYQLDDTKKVVAGWITDIDNLKNNILFAEKINARKNTLLEILSHDLKEPVAMINMMATAIKNSPVVAADATLQSYTRTIQQLCESNIQLIRSVAQQEFLEAQEIDLRLERVDMVWAVRDVMQQYKLSESLVNKKFYFLCEAAQIFVVIDNLKVMQVLNNLVSNAIKFTHDGGQITVILKEIGDMVRLTVSDDGIGIPKSMQAAIFNPHSSAQRPGLRGEPGSGMGLSIIKTLIELHGGRVWLDNSVSRGTTFHIELKKIAVSNAGG